MKQDSVAHINESKETIKQKEQILKDSKGKLKQSEQKLSSVENETKKISDIKEPFVKTLESYLEELQQGNNPDKPANFDTNDINSLTN